MATFGGLVPWRRDPFESFRGEFDRLFDRFFGGLEPSYGPAGGETAWVPDVDIGETDKEYLVTLDLPGVDEKDVNLTLTSNLLRIRGEKKLEKEERGVRWAYRGRDHGVFERVITLPANVDPSKARARYRKGLLEVTLPRAEMSTTKQIAIEAGEKEK